MDAPRAARPSSESATRCHGAWRSWKSRLGSVLLLGFVALLAVLYSGCGATDEQIGDAVQMSMQNMLDTDPRYFRWHLKVNRVQVVYLTGNLYQGTATIISRGSAHRLPLLVTYDGGSVTWETNPGAFDSAFK
jgi:hypothetical protein